ncbi:Chondroitin sulfate proteoglycan 4 [Eumeta japonica]|uniref:Chondroitin sulfate proteoglycan 4 n=1 Tax=Eumeta variegata TaxID=151549 RepID=A0A4C1YQM9_EUMVA|nr:Chondroitin sulfate proteoglycan 4 [Eumeta japonica]
MAYDKASFYGASYISYPLQEAKGTTDISFRFKTHLSDALLLLAAGKTDYCMIRLEGGRVKLHINLGAGESELSSSKGLHLNDTQWHHVNIIRREANLTMKVDENTVKKRLPGRFFELNIQFGIFLGGQGDFSELFLGHMENFRGCMEDVYYNGVKIIEKARSRSGSVRVEGVTWNCAPEFDADINSEISFIEEGAYLILPRINSRAGGRWQIEFKTITPNAMVLYNAGGGRGSDFLAVEILDGAVRVKMARGQIMHTVHVNDGQWHKMHLLFNPSLIELSVDNIAMSTRIESGGTRYLDLSDSFYLGGIEVDKRQRAFAKGVKAADSSIMGCIRPIEVDDKLFGSNAVVTHGESKMCLVVPQSSPGNPPCVPDAVCDQHGIVFSKLSSELELVALYPLTVQEGGVAVITTQNIDVILDHHKYGVRPSGVVFHLVRSPQYGRIAIDLSVQRNPQQYTNYVDSEGKPKQFFTLMDLSRDKVRYVHDGSENHQDSIVLDMELIPETKFTLPSYLQGRNTFVLHVNITPVNDPPVLNLLPGKVLRLTQILKISFMHVLKVVIEVVELILREYECELRIDELTVKCLLFVDDQVILTLSACGLQEMVNKMNVSVKKRSMKINVGHKEGDYFRYTESGRSRHTARIYRIAWEKRNEQWPHRDVWSTCGLFTQQDIDSGVISYVHDTGSDKLLNKTSLRLSLQVSDGIETSGPGILRISIVPLQVRLVNNTGLQIVHNSYAIITADNLTFTTNADDGNIEVRYDIVKPPQFGVVERLRVSDGTWQTVDSFTNEMVAFGRVRYIHLLGSQLMMNLRLHRRAYSHIQDEFIFIVGATECENITGVMTIKHVPSTSASDHPSGRVHTTLERLQVMEGSRMAIPATHLNFRTETVTNLIFNITHLPKHGKIEVVNLDLKIVRDNTTYFTLEELNSDRVYYAHDDSESRHDSFHFMALSPEPEDFQYVGVFHIDIILKNDNSPVRYNEKVFHIVHGGARLITSRDLMYTDADLDTKPSDIIYTVQRYTKDSPNGGLYRADNPSEQIAQFSQDDINKNLVLFKHQGKEYGKIAFWISDGLFDVNGNLDIQASPPFIRMYPTNGSIVENGKAVVITSRDMQVDTNMNCLEEDIRYEVTSEPKHGTIDVGEGRGATSFTQLDIAAGRVAYNHREPKTPTDLFEFKVLCLDTWGVGQYPVKIFPSSYWEPLRVTTNKPLIVEESTSVNITKDILEIMHPQIEPSNIVYKVIEGPNYGVNRTRDRIKMDVTNGIINLQGIELTIIIIPEHFYVSALNLTVEEGDSVSLKPDLFRTNTDYYRGKVYINDGSEEPLETVKMIALTENGKENVNDEDTPLENVTIIIVDIISGYIAMIDNLHTPVSSFTQWILMRALVFVHKDGAKGKMIFNVTDGLHELTRITFLISTKPIALKLVRKKNLRVFPLMREPLTSYLLMAKCSDPTRTITYKIDRAPSLGRLVILNEESHHRSVKQFTQRDLNDSLIYYEHTHPFSDLHTNDSFVFTVEVAFGKPIVNELFSIDISVSSGGLAKYVQVPKVRVEEGGKIPIKVNISNVLAYLETQAGLRQPNVEAKWSQPTHGVLEPYLTSLTKVQLETGVVNYQHDHSDTLEDKIEMSLCLLPECILLCNVTIPIHILPVNDQPFRLLTESPQIQVVQGENYTITSKDLLTEDADSGPSEIFYTIISGPTQGRIIMLGKARIDSAQSINEFTQDDINEGRIVYEHSGVLQTATFYFRVWDNKFTPTYTVFTIDVLSVTLNASSLLPIYLQQGSNVATVTPEQIYLETNGRKSKVWFNITRQPLHGMIYVGRSPVTYFSYQDIEDKMVIYMQNDMTTASDSFDIIAYVHNSNSTNSFTIEVIVQPLMALGDLRVDGSGKTKITLRTMDATGLAKLTASNPMYTIIRKPKNGIIKKIIRSSGEKTSAREHDVSYFTHEDIKSGVIYFVTKKMAIELNGIEDSFKFLLTATIFQPAAGEVKIFISNRLNKNLPGPNDPEGHEGVPVTNGETTSYYMLILMALSGLVLAVAVIVGLLKCRKVLAKDQNALLKIHGQSQGTVAPIPLPRPPDHLMPSPTQRTPPIKRYVSSDQSVHTGSTTPLPSAGSVACKVTPLAPDSPIADLNARYPYGAEDHTDADDWSSYEASEAAYPVSRGGPPANPMLRRNQYWV